ncbi:MAG: hypothetical protein ACI89J_003773 [Hyphomicrobiaceae bacterium]
MVIEPAKTPNLEEKLVSWAQVTYPWHRAFFIGLNGLLTATNFWTGAPWWALWPLVITGGLFTLHYLIYKTTLIDDAWVDERAGDLYDRSYDQGHIDSIAGHHDMETAMQRTEREMCERVAKREAEAERRAKGD